MICDNCYHKEDCPIEFETIKILARLHNKCSEYQQEQYCIKCEETVDKVDDMQLCALCSSLKNKQRN